MAWLDDRIWCHPKVTDLTDAAYRAYINGITYSSGFDTNGVLTEGQQKTIGATGKARTELVKSGLWDLLEQDGTTVQVHDWEEHNAKRDARRRADRERKKQERAADPNGWVTRTAEWRRTRALVFERDAGVCADCGVVTESWHADHVPDRTVLMDRGDSPFDLQFIVTRCPSCHGKRHSIERHRKRQNATEGSDSGSDTGMRQRADSGSDRRTLTGDRVTGEGSTSLQASPKAVTARDPEPAPGPAERPQDITTIQTTIAQSLAQAREATA